MAYTRKFNGKVYQYDSLCWSLESANARIKELRKQGFFARKTGGFTRITHSFYLEVWKLKKELLQEEIGE